MSLSDTPGSRAQVGTMLDMLRRVRETSVRTVCAGCLAIFLLATSCGDSLPPPGIVAPDAPSQLPLAAPRVETMGEYQIEALASFSLTARVLSKDRYWTGRESDLSPYDLALGWGRMSDSAVYGQLDIEQYGRWYHYQWDERGPPIPKAEIVKSSANMHIIPGTDQIRSALGSVDRHDVVHLEGYLVAVRAPDGWRWQSSMSRDDSGAGSCEVFAVTKLERSK